MFINLYVALLSGFYPAIFFLSNNWHIFSVRQSLVLLIGASLVALITVLPLSYALSYILQTIYRKSGLTGKTVSANNLFVNPIVSLCSLLTCVYSLRNTLASIEVRAVIAYAMIVVIIAYFVWSAHKRGMKPIFYALIVLSSLAAFNLLISVYTRTRMPVEDWLKKNKPLYDQVRFQATPNVYLVIAEAYPSRTALKAVYDYDNDRFYQSLAGLGFKMNHAFFSNYNHTLASLPSLFGMEQHFGLINLGNLDSLGGRRMLEAKSYNPVIDILRANNYKIQYLHEVNSLIPNGAEVDFCMPSPSVWYGLESFLIQKENPADGDKKSESLASIRNRIADIDPDKGPYFNFIYLNLPGHSPSRVNDRSREGINKKMGEFRGIYGKKIESANQQLLDLIQFIINKDRGAIIILIGDHGSWGFRLKEDAQGRPIPTPLFILDRFGVLAGIYAPEELSVLLENGVIKSHVNLFRYVFASLSADQKMLSTRARDDAYENKFIMAIEEGKILENFTKVTFVPGKKEDQKTD
jgi:hypothetical protein